LSTRSNISDTHSSSMK